MVDNPLQLARVIAGVLGRAPDARNAKLTAATLKVVEWTVQAAPGVAAADLDTPAMLFRMSERLLNFLFGMLGSSHFTRPKSNEWNIGLSTDNQTPDFVTH